MRNDFEYVPTIPVQSAKERARQHGKRAVITGIALAMLFTKNWKFALGSLILLTIMYFIQKKRLTRREAK